MRRGISIVSILAAVVVAAPPVAGQPMSDIPRASDGTSTMSGRDITFPDGRQLYLEGSAPPAPE
jgi:hypothetical protein